MATKWYENSFRRNLVDMHINDDDPVYMSRFDPVSYVGNLVTAGVDTAILYAGSCLGICYWPTSNGHMHRGLNGRDLLGGLIDECRHQGLLVNVYFNIWSRWAYDTYPDWRYRNSAGQGVFVESERLRYGLCCSNTPFFEYIRRQVTDLCSHYDMDGFWVDMIGWFGGICFCDACKQRYWRETGKMFPEKIDWRDPEWRQFQKHREKWFAELASMIRQTVKQYKPDCSVVFQSASWTLGWYIGLSEEFYRQSDYLAGDFYGNPIEQSFVCKYLDSLTENKPIEFMTSRCPTLYDHTTMKQQELLETQAFASISNNAAFVFIDAINPDGTVNSAPYPIMGQIFQRTKLYEPYLGPQLKRQADVAIYTDIYSLASMKDNGTTLAEQTTSHIPVSKLIRIAEIMIHHNIPYDVATRRDLDRLDRFQVLILPDAFMLDQQETEAIRRFVAQGGRLYASKNTSLIHGEGQFLLSDVLGVSWQGETIENETYFTPVSGYAGLHPFTADAPMSLNDQMTLVRGYPDTEVLAAIKLPYTLPNDPFKYSSAISNPPGIMTTWPALTGHRYGKGYAIYSAGCMESMTHDAHGNIFSDLVKSLFIHPPFFESHAPRSVEISLYDDPVNNRLILCLLNFQQVLPNIPVHDIKMKIRLNGRQFKSLIHLPDKIKFSGFVENDILSFQVDRLETFAMIAILF